MATVFVEAFVRCDEVRASKATIWLYPIEPELHSGYEHLVGSFVEIEANYKNTEQYRLAWIIVGNDIIGEQYEFAVETVNKTVDELFYYPLKDGNYWGYAELEWLNRKGYWEIVSIDFIEFEVIDALVYFGP